MLNQIFKKIENKEPFALIRFGDGEKNILNNVACNRKGFSFDPGDIRDCEFREELMDSLIYNGGKNYFIGIDDANLIFDISFEKRPDLGLPIIHHLLTTVRKSRRYNGRIFKGY